MRAETIDAPDERLKHAPHRHVEQYEGDLEAFATKTQDAPTRAKETQMKTKKTQVKATKVTAKAKTKKAPFGLKLGVVKDKQYTFQGSEHDDVNKLLEMVRVTITKGRANGLREVIISVRG